MSVHTWSDLAPTERDELSNLLSVESDGDDLAEFSDLVALYGRSTVKSFLGRYGREAIRQELT